MKSFIKEDLTFSPKFGIIYLYQERKYMLGYTSEQIDKMLTTLNYTIHHYVKGNFADEDKAVLRELEDFIEGLIVEGHIR